MIRSVMFPKHLPRWGRFITAPAMALLLLFALGACSSDDASTDLEIIGSYDDSFGGSHEITQTTWTQTSDFGVFVLTITSYSNSEDYLLGENEDATFSRLDWTRFNSDLYFCTAAFGEASASDAEAAGIGVADTTDPSAGGCGGSTWTRLDPAAQ